ncbi:TfoX/Sxy family protein [Sunxiuqinia sp. A32]|uniref:TfoX/Sxy family protein n=1 Tax=Sunxiuqinia sp. A32 TaxID=3461496 RepID=UPI0040467D08
MNQLTELPNIGKVIGNKLKEAEIETPAQLKSTGAERAFLRLSGIDDSACYNMLCALEGAIQNIRWHQLPKDRKEELKHFLNQMKLK